MALQFGSVARLSGLGQLAGIHLGRLLGLGQHALRCLLVLLARAHRCQVVEGACVGDDGGCDRGVQDGPSSKKALDAVAAYGVMVMIAKLLELVRLARVRQLLAASGDKGNVLAELACHDSCAGWHAGLSPCLLARDHDASTWSVGGRARRVWASWLTLILNVSASRHIRKVEGVAILVSRDQR